MNSKSKFVIMQSLGNETPEICRVFILEIAMITQNVQLPRNVNNVTVIPPFMMSEERAQLLALILEFAWDMFGSFHSSELCTIARTPTFLENIAGDVACLHIELSAGYKELIRLCREIITKKFDGEWVHQTLEKRVKPHIVLLKGPDLHVLCAKLSHADPKKEISAEVSLENKNNPPKLYMRTENGWELVPA